MKVMRRHISIAVLVVSHLAVMLFALGLFSQSERVAAQDSTAQLIINTRTPTPILIESPTPTRTPTINFGIVSVEPIESANIRQAPELTAQILKTGAKPGEVFIARGKFGKWFQIEFATAPGGLAWVYEDVVKVISGDPSTLPEVSAAALPTANVETAAAQTTAEFLTQTPGAPQTATALRASATGVFVRATETPFQTQVGAPLPTFTYPPPLVEVTLPPRNTVSTVSGSGLPPIMPILGLFVLGLGGLFVAGLRRGR